MSQLLLIQNHGEAPVEGYTVLGYSSTRNCGVDGTIGQFGSGAKHAINLCLRHNLKVWVYCGKTRLEFRTSYELLNDGINDTKVWHVVYRKDNAQNFKRAGWILDFGVLDWDDVGMAVREFVSNAIDRTIKEEGELAEARNAGRLSVKLVEESDRRAKSDFTRVYIQVNDDIREYFANLGRKFLHFSDKPEEAKPGLLEKKAAGPAQIYREGVWIRELSDESVFDYNFTVNEIDIDECRNSSDYSVKAACARKLKNAETAELSQVMEATMNQRAVVEATFDEYDLTGYGDLNETQEEKWKNAWEAAAGPNAVVCDNQFSKDYSEKKGHDSHIVPANWAKAIRKAGVKSALDVLSIDEQRGRTTMDATPDAQAAVDWAWELCQLTGLSGDREKPPVFCFQQIGTAESATKGYQDTEGVHIHIDTANAGQNNELRKTALEEVTHWITGATDNSRDFQNFLLDTIVSLAT
jgi:hypothetical protein